MLLVLVLLGVMSWVALRGLGAGPAGGSSDDGAGGGPAPSITPGETDTEDHIDQRPGGGGGDSEDDEDADDADDAENGGGDPDEADAAGGGSGDGGEDGTGEDGDGDGGGSDEGAGDTDAANGGDDGDAADASRIASLAECAGIDGVTASLRSDANAYAPGEKPSIRLTVRNESGSPCRVDVGHEALTLRLTTDDENVWTSAHCPTGAGALQREVPAGGSANHVVEWDGRYSSRDACEGPAQPTAPTGTYLAEADLTGFDIIRTTFRMDED
ncbi:hypothetical protein [Streptomyces bohaiensis]|uniref:DUF4232 domain-containing protein n=1 Tax=Streptomyces bohaiensis TaxID=1431344 RepID=A0ABX1C7E1_9ACTN|nr:hypothetical protein [Streptomyces bohaiensis]NJQ15089.1 hypothetical protein [Streptomyces bohaiensis]